MIQSIKHIFSIGSCLNTEEIIKNLNSQIELLKKENHKLSQYKSAIEESNIVSIGDLEGNITYVNDKFCDISLYSKDESIGKSHGMLRGEDSNEIFKYMWKTINNKKTWHGTLKNKKKNGENYYINSTIKPILDTNGNIEEFLAIRHEVTDFITKTEELEKNSRIDVITQEGNRFKLLEDIKNSNRPALALFDISGFGEINDFYGHIFGDEVLKTVSKIIKKLIPNNYKLYRIYSDEFAVLVDNEDKNEFIETAKYVNDIISSQPIEIEKKEIFIQLSCSISFEDKENIKKTANVIKRYAKKQKDVFIYDKKLGIEQIYEKNILWTLKLKKALEHDRITPFYQPIYNLKTNKIEKYEALVRLIDDDETIVSPFNFLDIAKKSKQYAIITKIMIKKSFEYFKDKDYEFSINLTIEDIKKKSISNFILDNLKEYDIASKVVFEIVESEGIDNFDEVNYFIDEVKNLGAKIAIDDFGSGYSNFNYLIKLNANFIKIDGSLIKYVHVNKSSEEIVQTIIDFAKKQGFKTIAEYVSNKEIFDKVKELGVDYVQGYFIGEPKINIL